MAENKETMVFEDLVNNYGNHDVELKQLKAECETEKDLIKNHLQEIGESTFSTDNFKVTRSESVRETFDETKAIAVIKNMCGADNVEKCSRFIKTKEVLDMDALEEALYAGEIDGVTIEELDKCRSKTTVVTLKCTKVKGK